LHIDRPCVGENLGKQIFLHGFRGGHIIEIQFGVPYIANILDIVVSSAQTGIEHMEHSYHVRKISLMVAYKKDVAIGKGTDNLRPIDLQFIESLIPLMR